MNKTVKELLLILITTSPFIYLIAIWEKLPQTVPTHFNFEGNADDWSDKSALIWLCGGLGLGMYLLMFFLPKFDPKKKLEEMGSKYFSFRAMLAVFFALINLFILFSAKEGSIKDTSLLFVLLGSVFAMFGNYFQTVRPNYFVGIRTPWTLESETVWKKTHRLGGKLWMAGGLLVIALAFMIPNQSYKAWIITGILSICGLIPVIFSFTEYRKEKKSQTN